jgi:hypothetical protein
MFLFGESNLAVHTDLSYKKCQGECFMNIRPGG